MNALIAEALHECSTPAAHAAAPLSSWAHHYDVQNLEWPEQSEVPDHPCPWLLLRGAAPLLEGNLTSKLFECSIDEQMFAATRGTDSDNPTYRQARASASWPHWELACDEEVQNLKRNGTFNDDESVLEDTLPTWDAARRTASQVVNIL